MKQLEMIFGELGLVQYLDSFVDQGFDSWDTVLDITEADLDVLGVKLGHRRKLQRRIANTRGVSADISLNSAKRPNFEGPRQQDVHRQEPPKPEAREGTNGVTKRKYRRHPKPDENAPERPPSAYVLFSNKMREDLKGRNLTFTEIAKLVGENWQSLSAAEKEPYESQAQALKDTYHTNLAEYRKTPEHKKYMAYLQEFKAKHHPSAHDKEVSKRLKLSESGGMSSSSTNATPNRTSRSGSGSSHRGSEPPPSRHQRLGSMASATDSQNAVSLTPNSYHNSLDDILDSPKTVTTDHHSDRSPTFSTSPTETSHPALRREPNWSEDQRMDQWPDQSALQRHLPPLSDIIDNPTRLPSRTQPPESNGYPFPRNHTSPGPPGLVHGEHRPPTFGHEQSSAGSTSSSASSFGFPRTPSEASMPIHSMLTSKSTHPFESGQHQQPTFQPRPPMSLEQQQQQQQQQQPHQQQLHQQPHGYPHQVLNGVGPSMINGYHREPSASYPPLSGNSGPVGPPPQSVSNERKHDAKLDGMSALLKAGEIVDRRTQ